MAKVVKSLSITSHILFAFPLKSEWAVTPIDLNKPASAGDWDGAGQIKFPKGFVMAKNNAKFLYLGLIWWTILEMIPAGRKYFLASKRQRKKTTRKDWLTRQLQLFRESFPFSQLLNLSGEVIFLNSK